MAIRAVVFDIGGVLTIIEDLALGQRWAHRFGLSVEEVSAKLTDVWSSGSIGTIAEAAVNPTIGECLGVPMLAVEMMMTEMWKQYVGAGNTELIDYLRRLRPRYRTGILSNSFVGAREREQAEYGFDDLVDEIVYSHEVGLLKPDPAIYELTWTRLGVAPAEMIFLDDLEPNIAAARELGIHAIHYRDNTQALAEIDALLSAGD